VSQVVADGYASEIDGPEQSAEHNELNLASGSSECSSLGGCFQDSGAGASQGMAAAPPSGLIATRASPVVMHDAQCFDIGSNDGDTIGAAPPPSKNSSDAWAQTHADMPNMAVLSEYQLACLIHTEAARMWSSGVVSCRRCVDLELDGHIDAFCSHLLSSSGEKVPGDAEFFGASQFFSVGDNCDKSKTSADLASGSLLGDSRMDVDMKQPQIDSDTTPSRPAGGSNGLLPRGASPCPVGSRGPTEESDDFVHEALGDESGAPQQGELQSLESDGPKLLGIDPSEVCCGDKKYQDDEVHGLLGAYGEVDCSVSGNPAFGSTTSSKIGYGDFPADENLQRNLCAELPGAPGADENLVVVGGSNGVHGAAPAQDDEDWSVGWGSRLGPPPSADPPAVPVAAVGVEDDRSSDDGGPVLGFHPSHHFVLDVMDNHGDGVDTCMLVDALRKLPSKLMMEQSIGHRLSQRDHSSIVFYFETLAARLNAKTRWYGTAFGRSFLCSEIASLAQNCAVFTLLGLALMPR